MKSLKTTALFLSRRLLTAVAYIPLILESICLAFLAPVCCAAIVAVLGYRVARGTSTGDFFIGVENSLCNFLLSPWTASREFLLDSPRTLVSYTVIAVLAIFLARVSVRARSIYIWVCTTTLALWTMVFATPGPHSSIEELKRISDSLIPGDTYAKFISGVPRHAYWKFRKPRSIPPDMAPKMSQQYGGCFLSDEFGPPFFVVVLAGEEFSNSGFLGNILGLHACDIVEFFFTDDLLYCGLCVSRLSVPPWKELNGNSLSGWVPDWCYH